MLRLEPIGVLRTPFTEPAGMPVQAAEDGRTEGRAEIDPRWAPALDDLAGFDRVWLLWLADRCRPAGARVVPFRDHRERGLFATRAPARPNPIGLSCVRLLEVAPATGVLRFAGVDMLDGTPLLDLKPYVWEWDAFPGVRSGWYATAGRPGAAADPRFAAAP